SNRGHLYRTGEDLGCQVLVTVATITCLLMGKNYRILLPEKMPSSYSVVHRSSHRKAPML
ncbi:MAG: hypothetical protein M1341_03125, partial [Candidatus Thermoplasmatota archaeon]|nr:hypothetical protein [Candidatus Thermoplasmatota archaeon]